MNRNAVSSTTKTSEGKRAAQNAHSTKLCLKSNIEDAKRLVIDAALLRPNFGRVPNLIPTISALRSLFVTMADNLSPDQFLARLRGQINDLERQRKALEQELATKRKEFDAQLAADRKQFDAECARERESLRTERRQLEELRRRLQGQRTTSAKVRLNVGGTYFTLGPSTLEREPKSVLATYATDRWQPAKDDDAHFVDRDPDVFQHIVRYLRTGKKPIVDEPMRALLLQEAQFWLLNDLVVAIENDIPVESLGFLSEVVDGQASFKSAVRFWSDYMETNKEQVFRALLDYCRAGHASASIRTHRVRPNTNYSGPSMSHGTSYLVLPYDASSEVSYGPNICAQWLARYLGAPAPANDTVDLRKFSDVNVWVRHALLQLEGGVAPEKPRSNRRQGSPVK